MKDLMRNTARWVLFVSSLLLPVLSAHAACASHQSIAYGQTINGSLSATDCTDELNGFTYYADYYQFTGSAGDKVTLQLSSSNFDPWLVLNFPSGKYTNNDNGGGGTTARIPDTSGYYTLPESGIYEIEVSSYTSHSTGNYTLEFAKETGTTILPSAPTNVTAIAGNGSATVSFIPGAIGSGTLVSYWAACGIDTTHLVTVKGSSSPITVTGLSNGTVYYCWALAESTVGYSSSWSKVSNTVTPTSTSAAAVSVVEFYNTLLDNYFITANSSEASAIDNGSAGSGWSRTGNTFASGGNLPVCRFYGSQSPGPNSHFYTADAGECAALKQLQASTPATQKRWNFESLDFSTSVLANGACPGTTVPVYRAYNKGYARNIDSNHRITSNLTAYQQQVMNCGWQGEGVVMCAPSGTSSGGTTHCGGSSSGGGGDGTVFTLMTNPTSGELLSAKRSDGTTVRYFGRRDSEGIPTSVDNIQVAAVDGKTTQIELDTAKRPAKIRASNGTAFDLTYSGKQAIVTALSPDGLTKVSATYSMGNGTSLLSQVPEHSGINLVDEIEINASSISPTASSLQSDWEISVNKCGVAFDDTFLTYNITGLNGSKLVQGGMPKHAGFGKWIASVPTNIKLPLDSNKIIDAAEAIADKLGTVCNALDYLSPLGESAVVVGMCPAITYVLLPTGPGALAIGSACEGITAAVALYCSTLGYDGPPEAVQANHSSLVNKIISYLKDQQTPPDSMRLQAFADTPTGAGLVEDSSIPVEVKSSGPFPPVTISVTVPAGSCSPVTTPVTISAISPATGSVGAAVTVAGTGFGTTQGTITFNGTAAAVSSWSDTLIKTTVPTGATTGNVVVKNKATAVASNGKLFTVTNAATIAISSISPTTGPVGATVTINGKGFGVTNGTVTFNGTAATVSSWSDTLINTTVPTGATTGNVVVKNKVTAMASNGITFTVGNIAGGQCVPMSREMCAYCSSGNTDRGVCISDPSCDPDEICPY